MIKGFITTKNEGLNAVCMACMAMMVVTMVMPTSAVIMVVMAMIEEEHALELRTRDRERKLLKKVEQALARIESGDYGWCEETGEPIGLNRLIARPTANLSLEAQERRELRQKLFGD
jgi:RNA polymerase-binding transcription factor DksA